MLPLFHLTAFLINAFTLWYDQNYIDFPFRKEILEQNLIFKNRFLMLTMWGLTLQTVYFGVALLNDILGSNERSPKRAPLIRNIKDTLFGLALPIALYVSVAFWGIYAIDKELILPDIVANVLPDWVNHVMHTTVAVFIFIELLFAPRTYPSRKISVPLIVSFVVGYLIYLHSSFLKSGTWIYPVLDVLPWYLRTVFFILSTLFGVVICIVGEKLDSIVNPKTESVKQKKR